MYWLNIFPVWCGLYHLYPNLRRFFFAANTARILWDSLQLEQIPGQTGPVTLLLWFEMILLDVHPPIHMIFWVLTHPESR